MDRILALKQILPYVQDFLGKTFVIKIGGEVCDQSNLREISEQLSLVHHIGIKVIVVHGGGPQMDRLLKRLGIERQVVAGRRITDEETLAAAKMVFAGQVNTDIVAALQGVGVQAVGLSGVDAGVVIASKRLPVEVEENGGRRQVDFGWVGDIDRIDPSFLENLLSRRMMPVISSLAGDKTGSVLNINADTVASRIAQSIGAEKMILMSNVPGLMSDVNDPLSLVSYADIETLQTMIQEGRISGGMLPKVQCCIEAVKNGVPRTHLIDGTREGSLLLELFVNEGCGTMIVNRKERLEYEQHEIEQG